MTGMSERRKSDDISSLALKIKEFNTFKGDVGTGERARWGSRNSCKGVWWVDKETASTCRGTQGVLLRQTRGRKYFCGMSHAPQTEREAARQAMR